MILEKIRLVADTTPADELRAIRKRLRLTQDEFAILLGTTRVAYKNWEYGSSQPGESLMKKARSLTITEPNATALRLRDAPDAIQSMAAGEIVVLPAWRAQGGVLGDGEFSFQETEDLEGIAVPAFMVSPGAYDRYRAVVVSGFSMAPRIESGALVVVRLVDEAAPGIITVVQAEAGKLYIKTFRRDNYGNPELHSIAADRRGKCLTEKTPGRPSDTADHLKFGLLAVDFGLLAVDF